MVIGRVEAVVDVESGVALGALGEGGRRGFGRTGEEDFEVVKGELATAADEFGVVFLVVVENAPDACSADEVGIQLFCNQAFGDADEGLASGRVELLLLAVDGEDGVPVFEFVPGFGESFEEVFDAVAGWTAGVMDGKVGTKFVPEFHLSVGEFSKGELGE